MANHDPLDLQAKRGLRLLGLLVVALALLVWWAATSGKEAAGPATPADERTPLASPSTIAADAGRPRLDALARLSEAGGELTILTDKPDDVVAAATGRDSIAKKLDVAYCGSACEPIKKALADEAHVQIETQPREELILPPKEALDTIAPGLTASERESVERRRVALVVRTQGPPSTDQIPARALFAIGALLADELDGVVWDETTRRIETAAETKQRAIKAPLGKPALVPRDIVVQFYRQEDGTARLLTLGMARFGSPDFTLRGATMAAGAMLVDVVNAVASRAAALQDRLPFVVASADVGAKAAGSVELEAEPAERAQGDPDDLVELVPAGGATREAWDDVVTKLYGEASRSVETTFDATLEQAAKRARDDLPGVLERFRTGGGELFVWAPFTIPEPDRADGGPEQEWLWVKVASCDARACAGTLSNRPMYASNIASGKTTSVPRDKIADYVLRLPDGGVTGGATTKLVEQRQMR